MKKRAFDNSIAEKIFRENEIKTNKIAVGCLLAIGLLSVAMVSWYAIGGYDLITPVAAWLLFAGAIIDFGVAVAAFATKFSAPVIKYLIIIAVLFFSGVLFFFYPLNATFISYGPLIISAVYFRPATIRQTAVLSGIIYSLALWANVWLEKAGGIITEVHRQQEVTLWQYPYEVLIYRFVPNTVIFILTAVICDSIARRGLQFLNKQAKMTAKIANTERELALAAEIQRSAMPKPEFVTDSVQIDGIMRPAKVVGGDFYDYFLQGENLVFLVADVSDKGLPAAMFMMRAKNAIRRELQANNSICEAVARINRELCRDNEENMFVTMWMAGISLKTGVGLYINCGHPAPIIKQRSGNIYKPESEPDLMLGVFDNAEFKAHPICLESGDKILVYTDGLTDAMSRDGMVFGDEALINTVRETSAEEGFCGELVMKINGFSAGARQFDDMTALCVCKKTADTMLPEALTFGATPESVDKAIDMADRLAIEQHCPDAARRDIDVAIDEICANIVNYAFGDGQGEFTVEYLCIAGFMKIVITWGGVLFNPLEAPAPLPGNTDTEGGLGIYLARSITDGFRYEKTDKGENRVTLLKIWKI